MKKWRTIIGVILMLALVAFIGVSNVGATASGFNSGIQVQNLDSTDATVTLVAYNKDGSVAATLADQTIGGGDSATYFPLDSIGLTGSFDGSVVVSADKPVAAISNVLATAGTGAAVAASYGGFSGGSDSVNLPLIMRGNSGFDTTFNVQNTNSSGDVDVIVTYTPSSAGNSGCTEDATIAPGAAATFDQASNSCLGDTFIGSATVAATGGDVVASALQIGPDTLFAYNGFAGGGSTDVAMPLINANNSGFQTGIQIQNVGSSDTDVTVSYTPSLAGTACTETQTVPAGGSTTFALFAFGSTNTGEDCADGATLVGSASISANSASQPLVAIVNQLNIAGGKGAAYNGFDPSSGLDTVSLPLMMDNNAGFFTGYSIVNVGSSSVDITCSYSTSGGHTPSSTTGTSIGAGEAFTVNDNGNLRPDASTAYVGSATCSAAGGSIVGIVNELSSGAGDLFLVYEGFSVN